MNNNSDNLKCLLARRNQLLRERDKLLRCEKPTITPDKKNAKQNSDSSCSVVECSDGELDSLLFSRCEKPTITPDKKNAKQNSDSSCSVVECSDGELDIQNLLRSAATKHNVVVNSSHNSTPSIDEEYISTSTMKLPKDHVYFTGKNSTNHNLKSPENDSLPHRIKILSDIAVNVEVDKENNILVTSKKDENLKYSISLTSLPPKKSPIVVPNDNENQRNEFDDTVLKEIRSQQIVSPLINFHSEPDNDLTDCSSPVIDIPTPCKNTQTQYNNQVTPLPGTSKEGNLGYMRPERKRKRKVTKKFEKSCLDFMSENEGFSSNGDFSAGSSDVWENKESDAELSSDEKQESRKKKKKMDKETDNQDVSLIKKQKKRNKRKERKILKNKGAAYETSTGTIKDARSLKPNPCVVGKCPRKCYEISEERRQAIFDYFWNLDNLRKKDWIVFNSKASTTKRKKTKNEKSRRFRTNEYSINEGEGRRMVCQKFLLKTLDISQKLVLYTLQNEQSDGLAKPDNRKPNVLPKYDEETRQSAKNFFESLAAVPSHYCRRNSKRLYLAQELKNVTNLHSIYKKERTQENKPFLSERLFINMFNTDYNYSFHIPKKDKCKTCTEYENNPEDVNEKKLKDHMREKEDMEVRFKYHQELRVPGNKTVVASFDLQKVLNTPYGDSMLLYYSRKYANYCFTVYESGTQNGYCYVWGESDGKRGSNDIGSCLYKYLEEVDKRGVKQLILYCDSCGGQNKNKTILALLRHFLTSSIHLETIQINYLLPGHTYMPVDSMHATIEREVRKITVWAPSQWPSFMESSRKNPRPYNVEVMEYNDFIDFEDITESTFTPEVIKNNNFRMRQVRIVTFKKKNDDSFSVKYSMNEHCDTHVVDLKLKKTAIRTRKNLKTDKKSNIALQKSKKGKGKGKGKETVKNCTKNQNTKNVSPSNERKTEKGKGIGKKTGKSTKSNQKLNQPPMINQKLSGKGKGKGKRTAQNKEQPIITTGKNFTKINTSDSNSELRISLDGEKTGNNLKSLYKEKLKISYQKYNDLKKLCNNGTIPKRYHKEYLSLPYSEKIKATLAETDEEDDISDVDD